MSNAIDFSYGPGLWTHDLPMLNRHQMSPQQARNRCVYLREKWSAEFTGHLICLYKLDNPFASSEALATMASAARRDRRHRKLRINLTPNGKRPSRATGKVGIAA